MNFQKARYQIFFLFLFTIVTGCVSVNLTKNQGQRSDSVTLKDPPSPFRAQESAHLDKLWQNTKDGSTISYLSDCNNPNDPSLENIYKGIVSEIDNVRVIDSSKSNFNSREALRTIVDGFVDGIETRFELLIFKKNHCIYIITYAGVEKAYADNQRTFQQFLKEYKVP
jgi:hypothetical protein